MDRNIIRYTFILSTLIFHYGQLTKGSSVDCTLDRNVCGEDEYCEEGYVFSRCVKRDQIPDYGDYRPNDEGNNYYRNLRYDFNTRRGEIPEGKHSFDESGYDSSEPTLEDKALIQSLPLKEKSEGYESDTRDRAAEPGPGLPPELPNNWDKVELRNDIGIQERGRPVADERHSDFENSRGFHEDVNNEQIEIEHLSPESSSSESDNTKDKMNDDVRPEKKDKSQDQPVHGSHLQSSNSIISDDRDSKGKVMIKGEVKKAEANIDQGPNPEINYERIKDFFKSQQASSIVEVPNAVKREENAKISKKNFVQVNKNINDEINDEEAEDSRASKKTLKIEVDKNITTPEALDLMKTLEKTLWINAPSPMFALLKVDKSTVHVRTVKNNYSPESEKDIAKRINEDSSVKDAVARQMSMNILKADQDTPSKFETKTKHIVTQHPKYFLTTLIVVGCVCGVILSAVAVYLIMKRYNETKKFKPVTLPGQEAAADYQELCRQFRASQGWEASTKPGGHTEKDKSLLGSAKPPPYSWSEEPVVPNMDISTGHVVLAYMEDHLNNKDRLNKEWEALRTYEAEPNATELGKQDKNVRKNRYSDVLPYDHNRVVLRETANASGSDYVNASFITDHDPRNPAYIATQGPLAHTVSDFWQMVWEQGVIVIVNLTRLSDLGLPQCHRYWPEEGHETYHIYEVHLVSEHIWCDDYLVRSFYLKNLQTSETRTVTQFHFLSWPDLNVPTSPKPLLEFRRKVNKCFRGRSCPIVVHCSGGVGRTGCYILIDMVLNKMMRGAKEIDIAATVEHLRDQRPHMVKTKAQFEFALTAVAEEVNAILQALAK